ncbi:MAG TPA: tRNA (adenosine(37)-N6)-threonylcarbamoyltransferase complex ATPase subunit type 1 TsaE [Chloroflexia bacterium]
MINSELPAVADLDIVSHGADQTRRLGAHLGKFLQPGDLLLLEGEFGSGKTTFTQGIAHGLGIDARYVNSPTFTLINEYDGDRAHLAHIDLYRLEGDEQVATLGLDDYLAGDGVTVIEWPLQAASWLPDEYLIVRFSHLSETKRTLRFWALGSRYKELVDLFKRDAYGA